VAAVHIKTCKNILASSFAISRAAFVVSFRTQLRHFIAAAPSTGSVTADCRSNGLYQRCVLPSVQAGAEHVRLPGGGLLLPLQMLLWLSQNSKRSMTATRTLHRTVIKYGTASEATQGADKGVSHSGKAAAAAGGGVKGWCTVPVESLWLHSCSKAADMTVVSSLSHSVCLGCHCLRSVLTTRRR
jgi:hypothetical protein